MQHSMYAYVIVFWKTWLFTQKLNLISLLNVIVTLKHFPPYSVHIAIDNQVCLYRWHFTDAINPWKPNYILWATGRHGWLGSQTAPLNVYLAHGMVSSHCGSLSGLLWHTSWLAVSTGSDNLATHPLYLPFNTPPIHPSLICGITGMHSWYCSLCSKALPKPAGPSPTLLYIVQSYVVTIKHK